jgi:hypothetical protein
MRALLLAAALGALAVLLVAPVAPGSPGPQRIQVTQDEWFLNLSRPRLKAGKVTIEVVNFGQDAHDLVIQRKAKGAAPIHFAKQENFLHGGMAEKTVTLKAGRYTLWCSLPQHKQRGMVAALTVG